MSFRRKKTNLLNIQIDNLESTSKKEDKFDNERNNHLNRRSMLDFQTQRSRTSVMSSDRSMKSSNSSESYD